MIHKIYISLVQINTIYLLMTLTAPRLKIVLTYDPIYHHRTKISYVILQQIYDKSVSFR